VRVREPALRDAEAHASFAERTCVSGERAARWELSYEREPCRSEGDVVAVLGARVDFVGFCALIDRRAMQSSPSSVPLDRLLTSTDSEPPPPPVRIRDRVLHPTVVFNTYWQFAFARQAIYLARLRRSTLPSTHDAILRNHRFTNVFRASDRVSQFLISSVQHGPSSFSEPADLVFRTRLFKVFNRQDAYRSGPGNANRQVPDPPVMLTDSAPERRS
jgi:hypothetical protein